MQEFLLAFVAVLYFTVFALLWGDDTADEKQKQVGFFFLGFFFGGRGMQIIHSFWFAH